MSLLRWNLVKCLAVLFYIIARNQVGVCTASVQMHHHSSEEDYDFNKMPQEKIDKLKVPADQTLVVRLPLNTLLKYTSYKDVSILHFRVPPDTRTAFFTFKAYEESKSAFQRKCKPRSVELHLKPGSYPVISPENITFPKNFLDANQRSKTYSLQFMSNEEQQRISINGPQFGNWFAVAFVSWTDPNNDRIEQQGLSASCDSLLLAEMSVTRFQPYIIYDGHVQIDVLRLADESYDDFETKDNQSNLKGSHEFIYKFYVSRNIEVATAIISIKEPCQKCPNITIQIQSNAFPNSLNESHHSDNNNYAQNFNIIQPNQVGDMTFEFYVQPEAWHYLHVAFANEKNLAKSPEVVKHKQLSKVNSSLLQSESISEYRSVKRHAKNTHIKENHFQQGEKEENCTFCHQVKYSLQIIFLKPIELQHKEIDLNYSDPFLKTNTDGIKFSTAAPEDNITTEYSSPLVQEWRPNRFRNIDFYPLLRQTYREFFMFDYDLMPDENGTVPTVLNLTGGMPAGFAFEVGDVYDIGGTLTFALLMKQELKSDSIELKNVWSTNNQLSDSERGVVLAEKFLSKSGKSSTEVNEHEDKVKKETVSRSNQTIIVCMHLAEPGVPSWPDKCRYGQRLLPASIIINNTDSNTMTGLLHVPFPESGQWYITMELYCHGAETAERITIIDNVKDFVKQNMNTLYGMSRSCSCFLEASHYLDCVKNDNCLNSMNETEALKIKECLMDSKCTPNYLEMARKFEIHNKFATEQHIALEICNASVIFTISSSPCVAGRCGRFGRCYHYMSGGFVFSTCMCMKGYRGWDCTEVSQVPSSISILVASLLLTLSNLLFIPSIYLAMRLDYYTEATIYFFAMFFSIFYHACDSGEDEYSFCLVKIGVLQFCDFYCGLMAIWVTLIAMSHIRQQLVSILHMFGAIILAFGTELNKQSLWVFLAPALTGICLISTSWGIRCYKLRKWYPAPKYLIIYMPLGTILVMIGLICYAFLQTKQNYHIVHSIWHIVMALSILCLLPSRKYFLPKC
ncbi:uncharacterized protein LOC129244530 [Anastrepha obliqua]|uniref:uncharacterized protein LOC129244530 n=1 Tax=Anastrepha obliqua TaxID=95512 RepID=UPI002409F768|nr:uncharacterized protein LOC129244530 [Anastrepha obliqua]